MTDEEPTRQHPESRGEPRRLFRSRDNRVLGGVAGGVARYFAIDPIIVRIAFAALAVFGGVGVFLYLAALLFVPSEGAEGQPAGASLAGRGRLATALGAGALAVAGIAILGDVFWFPGPIVLLAVGAIALYALLRTDGGAPPSARRVAVRIAVGVALLAASIAGLVLSAWASGMGYGVVVAGVVVVLGLLLVAGAVTRRREARWLVLPALVLAVPLGIVSAAGIDLRGGFGERLYRPASAAEVAPAYRLGAGRMEIDLRSVDFAGPERRVDVGLGMGEAIVVVPRNVCVETHATVGAGLARSLDRADGGMDVEVGDRVPSPPGVPRVVVNADLGMGQLQVVNDPRAAQGGGHRDGDGRGRGGRDRGSRDSGPPWSDRGEGSGPPWSDRGEGSGPPWSEDGPGSGPPWRGDGPGRARGGDSSVPPQDNAACRPATAQARGGDR